MTNVLEIAAEARNHITPTSFDQLVPGTKVLMVTHSGWHGPARYQLTYIERVFPKRQQVQVMGYRYNVRNLAGKLDFHMTDGAKKENGRYRNTYVVPITTEKLDQMVQDENRTILSALGDEMLSALSNEKGRWLQADEITALQNVVMMIKLRRQAEDEKRQKEQPVIEAALRNS